MEDILKISNLPDIDQRIVDEVLSQDVTGKSNEQIAKELNISLRTFYRRKSKESVANEILQHTKQKAEMLLPLAVQMAEKMLLSEDTSDTARVNLIKLIYQNTGITKPDEPVGTAKQNSSEENIERLMVRYGIRKEAE